jgi:predicted ATPase
MTFVNSATTTAAAVELHHLLGLYLARRKMRAPLLLIGTCREEGPDGHSAQAVLRELHAYRLCTGLPVRPLRTEDVAQYLLTRFHGSIFSADVAALFHRSTDGNPLFLVNLLDHLLQQGMLVPRNGQLALAVEAHVIAITVPRNLKPLLDQQLDQLSPEMQRVLEVASVVGARFAAIVVAAALGSEVAEIEDRCTALARQSRFVEQDGDVELPDGTHTACYRFIHAIYRHLLYERTTKARRVQLHRQMGMRLAAVYGERGAEFTESGSR